MEEEASRAHQGRGGVNEKSVKSSTSIIRRSGWRKTKLQAGTSKSSGSAPKAISKNAEGRRRYSGL